MAGSVGIVRLSGLNLAELIRGSENFREQLLGVLYGVYDPAGESRRVGAVEARWSKLSDRYVLSLISILPSRTTGRFVILWIPIMATSG